MGQSARWPPGINGDVNPDGPPSPAHSQGVIARLTAHRPVTVTTAAGSARMSPADARVHQHLPVGPAGDVSHRDQPGLALPRTRAACQARNRA